MSAEWTQEEKLEQFPFNSVYMGVDPLEMLIWYEHDEGHNAIAAGRRSNILTLWTRRVSGDDILELKEFWVDVRSIRPSDEIRILYANRQYEDWYERFGYQMDWKLRHYKEFHGRDHPRITPCLKYLPPKGTDRDEHRHYHCRAGCLNGMMIKGCTWREFWLQKRDLMATFHANDNTPKAKARQEKERLDKLAAIARDRRPQFDMDTPVYMLSTESGHHCKGIGVVRVKDIKAVSYSQPLMFFHGTKIKPPKEFIEPLKARLQKFKDDQEKREQGHKAFKEKQQRKEQDEMELLMKLE